MDFDLDDPLGDLLSDGSNDSFFGTSKKPIEKTKSSTSSTTDVKSKAKVANLFGIDEKTTNVNTVKSNIDIKPTQSTFQSLDTKNVIKNEEIVNNPMNNRSAVKQSTPIKNETQSLASDVNARGSETDRIMNEPMKSLKKETRFDESDDFLNELGFDPKHPKGNIGKKSNILDDILNFSKPEQLTKTASTPPSKPSTANDMRNSKPIENNPTTNRYSPSLGRPRNLRSGSTSTADPLGLFTTPTKNKTVDRKNEEILTPSKTKSKPAKKSTVDWLGLNDDSDEIQKESTELPTNTSEAQVESIKPPSTLNVNTTASGTVETETVSVNPSTMSMITVNPITATVSSNLNLMTMASMEKEQALHSLQQQQTQLRVAAQMKQQENILHDMHVKQQALIKQQENQFNDLLQRQITRQNQLEAHIQQQQDQINAYINVLMNQPSVGLPSTSTTTKLSSNDFDEVSRQNDEIDASRQHVIELEADVKRLELEKLRLEDTLQSIQTSHEQELELLHASHK